MMRSGIRLFCRLGMAAGITAASVCFALAAPSDIVPRGDIAYDQLGSLAAAGYLPGYSLRDFARGDRLYTRDEIARIVTHIPRNRRRGIDSDSPFAAAERALLIRFAPELSALAPRRFDEAPLVSADQGLLGAQGKLRALTGPATGDAIGRASWTLPVGREGFVALSLGNGRDEWYDVHPGGIKNSRYPLIETAFVRVNGRALDVSVGRSPLRWGPGYVGGLLFSDNAPAVDRLQVEKSFHLPGNVGRRLGKLYFTQFAGGFFEPDVTGAAPDARGTRRYLAGRRIEAQGGARTFSIAESFKSTRLPDPEWAMVLPFYLYQNDWTKGSRSHTVSFLATGALPDTYWLNYMGDAGITYRTGSRAGAPLLYGDLLLDDIKAPKGIGLGDDTPRKIGYQLGVYTPRLGGNNSHYGARLEYAYIDARTYTDISPPITYSYNGVPLGYPAGSGVRVLFGRVDAAVSDKVRLAVEGRDDHPQGSGTRLASVLGDTRRLSLFGTYSLRRDLFVGTRIERRTGITATGSSKTRAELNVGYGF